MITQTRRISLEEFAADAEAIVRDVLLGRIPIVVEDERGGQVMIGPMPRQPAEPRVVEDREEIHRQPSPEDVQRTIEGINRAAGGWKGLMDADEFKAYIRERRRTKNRLPVRS